MIWGAGVMASPAGLWLGAETDRAGRVKVTPDLSVPGHPDIFVIGDTAALVGADGKPLPGVAPVAKQQGQYVAELLLARQNGKTVAAVPLSRLRLARHHRAQARRRADGPPQAEGLHRVAAVERRAHLFPDRLPQPVVVATNWLWNYLTFQRGTRLITGMSGARMDDVPLPEDEKPPLRGAA